MEDAQDRAAVAERRAHERRVGKEAARRDYLTADEAIRLLGGDSPVKVWREKRGVSQRALAAEAGIGNGYLAEIETNRKPGSDDALRKLAAVLHVPPEELDGRRYRMRDPEFGPVQLCFIPDSAGVAPGHHLKLVGHTDFATLRCALAFVRERWSELRSRSPWITNTAHRPIYTSEELFHEFE
ncbi:MAG TPA: helix-turn-helix transcriptional regulator [Stellaceae bacterium]|nr:helix-turn-helix transcriptional regulator [Stellaceae bacterium]